MEQRFEKEVHGGQFGEIHNHYAKKDEPIPHSHLTVICPQCSGESYRFNEYCNNGKCTFGIRAYFDELEQIAQEQEREKRKGRCSLIGLSGLVFSIAIGYIGSQWFHMPRMAFWFLGGFVWLFLWLKAAEQQ